MPRVSLPELLDKLAQRPPHAVVFLPGEEEYLRDRAIRRILEKVLDPATRDFNLDQLRGAETTPETLGSILSTPPMMAEWRVVVVREAQALSAKAREVVEGWFARPAAGLVLVVGATIPSGSKAKFYDVLRAKALTVECPSVDAHDLPGWLVEHVRSEHGRELEVEAARALGAAIGSTLGILATEVEKVVAYVGDRRTIGLEDVRAVGGYIPRVDRWAWFDLIGERRFRDALRQVPELLATGETAVGLVIGIGGHLLKVGLLVAGGRDALDRHLPPHQRWLINRLQPQAKRWTAPEIDRALGDLLRTDRLLKSASLTDRQALEELLLRFAGVAAERGGGSGGRVLASAR